jgi:hypothetical protein
VIWGLGGGTPTKGIWGAEGAGYSAIGQARCQLATDALAEGFAETMWIAWDRHLACRSWFLTGWKPRALRVAALGDSQELGGGDVRGGDVP